MSLLPEINQASAEINKLVAQANIHQTIAPVNPAAFTDPADTLLLASRDPVIREVSVGMTGVEAASYTVSGTPPLSLPNSLGKPLKAWSVDVLPYQEGTGDPSPDNVRAIHGTDKLNLFVADSYDPTATPTTVIDVPPLSANKWDEEWEVGSYSSTGQKVPTQGGRIRSVNKIAVSPSTSYYALKGMYILCQYDENEEFVSFTQLGTDSSSNVGHLFTTEASTHYITFATYANYGATYNHDIAINYPSTVTTYNPYNATVYTGTIGSEGGESRCAMVDMGDMTWDRVGSNGRFYSSSIRTLVKAGSDADGYDNAFAETYKAQNVASLSFLSDYCMSVDTSGNVQLYDSSKAGMTGVDLKTALTGIKMVYKLATPVQFVLSAPDIPTPRGTATTWATAEDGTVESMEVTYYKSE